MTGNALSAEKFEELTAVTMDVGNKMHEAIISMNLDVARASPEPMLLSPTYRPLVTPPSTILGSPFSAPKGSLPASSPPSSFPGPECMSEDSEHSGADEKEEEEDVLRRRSQMPSRHPPPIPGDFWDKEGVSESSRCPDVQEEVEAEAVSPSRSQRLSRPPIPRGYDVSEDESDIYINDDPNHNRNNQNNANSSSGRGNGGNNYNNYGRYNYNNSSNGNGGNGGSNYGRYSNNGGNGGDYSFGRRSNQGNSGNRCNRGNGNSGARVIDSSSDSDDGIDRNLTVPARPSLPGGLFRSTAAGCAIDGTSSFTLLGGFCKGAKNLVLGEVGVREPKPRWAKVCPTCPLDVGTKPGHLQDIGLDGFEHEIKVRGV